MAKQGKTSKKSKSGKKRKRNAEAPQTDRVFELANELAQELFGKVGPFVVDRCTQFLNERLKQTKK